MSVLDDEGGPEEFARQAPFRKLVTEWLVETMGGTEADNIGKQEFCALVDLAERAAAFVLQTEQMRAYVEAAVAHEREQIAIETDLADGD